MEGKVAVSVWALKLQLKNTLMNKGNIFNFIPFFFDATSMATIMILIYCLFHYVRNQVKRVQLHLLHPFAHSLTQFQ